MPSSPEAKARDRPTGGHPVPNDQTSGAARSDAVPTVGVIGLGAIGDGVATSVLRQGLPLVVCDVRPEATEKYRDTAEVASSPADLVGRCDVVVVAVVNDEQVHAVLSGPDGGLAAGGAGTTVIVVSTISAAVRPGHRGRGRSALGVPVLDCGVTGGPAAAASGDLVCMVGGDPDVIERVGAGVRRHQLPDGDHGAVRYRAGGQAGPQPDHLRLVAGRLRGPTAGRGGRHLPGPTGRGGEGQRRPHRGRLPSDVPADGGALHRGGRQGSGGCHAGGGLAGPQGPRGRAGAGRLARGRGSRWPR